MPDLGRLLILAGALLLVLGLILVLFGRLPLSLGHLPGDLNWRGRGWRVSVPLATSLLLSLVLSLLFWIIGRLR